MICGVAGCGGVIWLPRASQFTWSIGVSELGGFSLSPTFRNVLATLVACSPELSAFSVGFCMGSRF